MSDRDTTASRRRYLQAVGSFGPWLIADTGGFDRVDVPSSTDRGEWEEQEPLPAQQSDAGGGVIDGILYYFGGFAPGIDTRPVKTAFAYDPSAGDQGRWDEVESMPRALWGMCGVATEDALYSFGGASVDSPYGGVPPSDEIFRYRPEEGWTNLTAEQDVRCPYRNWAMRGIYNSNDGLVYCVGGGTGVTDRESATNHGAGSDRPGTYDESRVWTFDPESEVVADPDLARMPRAKRWPAVALVTVDGRPCLHAIAGRFGGAGPTNTNYRYDIERDEWLEMEPAPLTGNYGTTSNPVIDGTVYLTHGITLEGDLSMDIYQPFSHRYDPETDTFRTDVADPAYPRTGPVDAVIDETLYVVGGHMKRYDRNNEHQCLRYNEAFTPSTGC